MHRLICSQQVFSWCGSSASRLLFYLYLLLAHLSLWANGWAYSIGRFRRPPSTLLKHFSSETTGPIETKFHTEPPWDRGTKVCSNGPGHVTKIAAMPIYGKKPFKNLLPNQQANELRTWYTTSGTGALQSCSNEDPGLTLTYFTARSTLLLNAFVWENA